MSIIFVNYNMYMVWYLNKYIHSREANYSNSQLYRTHFILKFSDRSTHTGYKIIFINDNAILDSLKIGKTLICS